MTAADTATSRDSAGLLVLIDYADRWPIADLLAILDAHINLPGPVRVLLVARGVQGWWKSVEGALLDAGIDEVDEVKLPPLADGLAREGLDAHHAFNAAVTAFSPYLGLTDPSSVLIPEYASALGGEHALTLYMAALVAVDATARGSELPSDRAALSTYLLDRELKGWEQLASSGKITSTPQQIRHASMVAALTQAVPYSEGIQVVQATGIATSDSEADQLLRDHKVAYPTMRPEMVLDAMAPDRLAEDYIALTIPGSEPESDFADPWAVSALSRLLLSNQFLQPNRPSSMPTYLRPAVIGLVEAASRWPHLLPQALRPILDQNPALVLAGGGATTARLASLADGDNDLLNLIAGQLPPGMNLDFDEAAVVVSERRMALVPNASTNTAEHAKLLAELGYRYHNVGRRQDALAPTQEAADTLRMLADPETGRPAAYLPDLAMSLNNLGALLADLGRHQDALAPTQEAADILRMLADPETGHPAAYLPDLAMSLNNLGALLADLGRHQDALAPTEKATDNYRMLSDPATGNPAAYLPYFAGSLNNIGIRLAQLGRHQDALAPTQKATETYRMLSDPTTGNPAAYLPDLAMSLNNLGNRLADLGRHHDALAPTQEAADIYRTLADPETGNPAAYLPNLAGSLNNFGIRLAQLGRHRDALAPTQEAANVRRVLANPETGNPAAYLRDFAGSLNNLGNRLAQLGRHQDALAPTQEAINTFRTLANPETGNPAYLPNLAMSLNNLGNRLAQLGRHQDAFAPTQEAINTFRTLANPETGNPAYLPNLATSLGTMAEICRLSRRHVEAGLSAAHESVKLHETLAAAGDEASRQRLGSIREIRESLLSGGKDDYRSVR
ncbi:tetratricopeptide repeat protein [Arthrobacter sp. MDB2-24]